jgi:hypothetical protein
MYENTGDSKYLQKLKTYERQFKSGSTLVETFENTTKTLFDPKEIEANYNPYLDEEKRALLENLGNSEYVMKDGKISLPSFENPEELQSYTFEELSALISNQQWSGNPDFGTIGSGIAGNIKLFDNNGNKRLNETKEREAITLWKNRILDNDVERATLARKYGIEPESEEGLTPKQINDLAVQAYNEYTRTSIQESARREPSSGGGGSSAASKSTFTIATDAQGTPVTRTNIQDVDFNFSPQARIYSTGNAIKTPEGVLAEAAVIENGKLSFIGINKVKRTRDRRDADGNRIVKTEYDDGTFDYFTESYDDFEPAKITDDVQVDFIAKKAWNPQANRTFENQAEFIRYLQGNPQSTTPQTAEGDSIFD